MHHRQQTGLVLVANINLQSTMVPNEHIVLIPNKLRIWPNTGNLQENTNCFYSFGFMGAFLMVWILFCTQRRDGSISGELETGWERGTGWGRDRGEYVTPSVHGWKSRTLISRCSFIISHRLLENQLENTPPLLLQNDENQIHT